MTKPNLELLIEAMTSSLDSIRHYYDRTSGDVVTLSEEFGEGGLEGPADSYILVTPLSVSERFQIMEDFVETVENEALQEELNSALIEKGAFLRFEEVLQQYPTRRQQWESFRSAKVEFRARAWLKEHGIAPG